MTTQRMQLFLSSPKLNLLKLNSYGYQYFRYFNLHMLRCQFNPCPLFLKTMGQGNLGQRNY